MSLERLQFVTPDRSSLPPLSSYATLNSGGSVQTVGYTEASRGCRHLCRHCPIVPIYNGTFRVVQRDENLDLMDQYKNQGLYRSVPTFVFLDANLSEIGNLKERAESMTQIFEAEQIKVRRSLRDQNKDAWRKEMMKEFHTVVAEKKRYP